MTAPGLCTVAQEKNQSESARSLAAMGWIEPAYSKTKVDLAGFTYADPKASSEDREMALAVINNWRSSHSFPLNTLQINLRNVVTQRDDDPTTAQRIKRLPSIRHKLERIPGMKLSRMQDIGGGRAVLSSVEAVNEVTEYYKTKSRIKHRLVREDPYILTPKASGYRGVHLVYRYYSDRSATWNGLNIELQIRSRLQHAWATAVETVGTFTQQALKSSSGEADWLRFFALMSSALALREGTPTVPGTPSDPVELSRALRRYVEQLDVINRLTAYGEAVRFAEGTSLTKGHRFLIELDVSTATGTVTVWSFDDAVVAAEQYSAIERAVEGDPDKDVVLVTVESLASLRRAYPNYFLDTTAFLEAVEEAIE